MQLLKNGILTGIAPCLWQDKCDNIKSNIHYSQLLVKKGVHNIEMDSRSNGNLMLFKILEPCPQSQQ